MNQEWENMDILQLQHLYKDYSCELEKKLLNGVSWQEVSEQRREVTELAIAIYRRLNPSPANNPAERPRRTHQ